ncbi:SUR7/PalI family domain-containing protein [Purpureocillium lavendulum]|uniref:SUR7/PalI family domain-containing protein n=1 Tax=Purpureocillium lavendulum TaxID=1247861 RepID=A0AB34G206_9HYPO|nr:SUR7/PalI family domain-containing protein [Purpureocillium lavendulum]
MARLTRGRGHLALASLPFVLSLFTAIIFVLIFAAGTKPGTLENLSLFQVNVGSLTIPSKLSSSKFLQDLEKVSGGDLTGSSASPESLGLASRYSVYIYTTCAHFVAETTCSPFKVGSWFNPQTTLKLDSIASSIRLSDDFEHTVDTYKKAAYFIGIGIILAFVCLVLSVALSGASRRFRTLTIWAAALSWVSTALLLASSITTVVTARRISRSITSELGGAGISAELGKIVYLPFFAFALSLIISVLLTTGTRGTTPRRIRSTTKKPLIVGNAPAASPKPGLLQRVTTWSRHRYVQVEKQPVIFNAPDHNDAVMANQPNALRGQRDFDYGNPADERDIAMVSLGGGGDGRDQGAHSEAPQLPRELAYEPYSTQLPPRLSLTHDRDLHQLPGDDDDILRPASRISDVRDPEDDRPLIHSSGVSLASHFHMSVRSLAKIMPRKMGGKIDCYIDISSFYSYLAFYYLIRNLDTLKDHGVEVEFHPVFAGVVQSSADNTPPWAVSKQKRDYLAKYETGRAKVAFGKPEIVIPEDLRDLLELGWTQKSCRALLYIKDNHPRRAYHTTWHYLFHCFWTVPRRRVRDESVLAEVLAEVPADFDGAGTGRGSAPLFSNDDVAAIMANQGNDKYKAMLKDHSAVLNQAGAFGVPWLIIQNQSGLKEPFFGSDRFRQIFQFLDVPVQEFELLPLKKSVAGVNSKL